MEVGQQQYPHEDRCLSKPLAPLWGQVGNLPVGPFLVPMKSYPAKGGKASEFDRIAIYGL
jgi:hypothetical protein